MKQRRKIPDKNPGNSICRSPFLVERKVKSGEAVLQSCSCWNDCFKSTTSEELILKYFQNLFFVWRIILCKCHGEGSTNQNDHTTNKCIRYALLLQKYILCFFFFKPLFWPWVTSSLQTIRAPPTHRPRTWNFRKNNKKQGTSDETPAKYLTAYYFFIRVASNRSC